METKNSYNKQNSDLYGIASKNPIMEGDDLMATIILHTHSKITYYKGALVIKPFVGKKNIREMQKQLEKIDRNIDRMLADNRSEKEEIQNDHKKHRISPKTGLGKQKKKHFPKQKLNIRIHRKRRTKRNLSTKPSKKCTSSEKTSKREPRQVITKGIGLSLQLKNLSKNQYQKEIRRFNISNYPRTIRSHNRNGKQIKIWEKIKKGT